ncbi:hypothetical protein [Nocardia sp. NPDC004604]|uniref:hypothetical protein n=1 Tax=Nocardia sp. NPDC004604 TaxID=3157013 RepID=UPI0033B2DBDE
MSTRTNCVIRADELITELPAPSWQRLSVGARAHGPREYERARRPIGGTWARGRGHRLLGRANGCVASAARDASGTFIGAIGVTGRSAALEHRSLHTGLVRSVDSPQREMPADRSAGLSLGKPAKSFGDVRNQYPRWTPNLAPLLDVASDSAP